MEGNVEKARQKSDGWLDPLLKARITCHEITWWPKKEFEFMHTAGDLYFHKIPLKGTLAHRHDFSEIIFINSGSVIHRVNGERQVLSSGNLVFLRPDDEHCFLPDGQSEMVEIIMVDFSLDLFLSMSIYFENDFFLQQLTASVLPPLFKLKPDWANELYTKFLKLNSPTLSPQFRKIKVKMMLADLFSRFFINDMNLLTESQVPKWLETLCIQMRKVENFSLGIERMQQLAFRSPGHLCKSFQKYLGKTPTEYVNDLRINHASRLLVDTREEIIDIAESLNFQSLSRFYYLFKKSYGMSPAAYRKLHSHSRKF